MRRCVSSHKTTNVSICSHAQIMARVGNATECAVQGNCSETAGMGDPDAEGLAVETALVPLKPFQCRLIADADVFRVTGGNVWLDNLYFAAHAGLTADRGTVHVADNSPTPTPAPLPTVPLAAVSIGRGVRHAQGAVHGTGVRGDAAEGPAGEGRADARLYLTNVTVQGGDAREMVILSSAPGGARASVLAQGAPPMDC